jgi:phosphoadenosine phosphosulfate reductase
MTTTNETTEATATEAADDRAAEDQAAESAQPQPVTGRSAVPLDHGESDAIRLANELLDRAGPGEILEWAVSRYGQDLTLACSFGGASGMVLLDMVQQLQPSTEVFYIDTDYLFEETHQTLALAREHWPLAQITGYGPDLTPEAQAAQYGAALWERDPDLCCDLRKVEPNRTALLGKRAWISGLRRDQTGREETPAVLWDEKFGLAKVNPLINWDEKLLWSYIFERELPYNVLLDRGYPSIGCTNCTNQVQPGEDPRAGRWAGFDKLECGLHTVA